MRRKTRMLLFAPLAALLVLAAIAGRVEVGDAAPQVAPRNEAPPTITGTPQEGQALTAATGRWSGTEPITYAFAWRRCGQLARRPAAAAGGRLQGLARWGPLSGPQHAPLESDGWSGSGRPGRRSP